MRGDEVVAVGVSGQHHGLVVLDEKFEVIRPAKLWNDTETAPQNAEMIATLGVNEAATCAPRAELRAAYYAARATYRSELVKQYPALS